MSKQRDPEPLERDGDVIWLSRRRARKHAKEEADRYREREMEIQEDLHPRPTALDGFPSVSPTSISRGKSNRKYAVHHKSAAALRAECALRGDTEPLDTWIAYLSSVRAEMRREMADDGSLAPMVEEVRREFERTFRRLFRASMDGRFDPGEKEEIVEVVDELIPDARKLRNRCFRTASEPEPLTGE